MPFWRQLFEEVTGFSIVTTREGWKRRAGISFNMQEREKYGHSKEIHYTSKYCNGRNKRIVFCGVSLKEYHRNGEEGRCFTRDPFVGIDLWLHIHSLCIRLISSTTLLKEEMIRCIFIRIDKRMNDHHECERFATSSRMTGTMLAIAVFHAHFLAQTTRFIGHTSEQKCVGYVVDANANEDKCLTQTQAWTQKSY